VSLKQEKMDEFRQDCKIENKMRDDFDYFIENSHGYDELVKSLEIMKNLCSLFGHDLDEVLVRAKDEV